MLEVIQRYVGGGEGASGRTSNTEGEKKHTNLMTLVPTSLIHICWWRLNFKQVRKENSTVSAYMNARLIMAAERERHKGHIYVWSSVNMCLGTVCGQVCVVPKKVLALTKLLFSKHCYIYSAQCCEVCLPTGRFKGKVDWLNCAV